MSPSHFSRSSCHTTARLTLPCHWLAGGPSLEVAFKANQGHLFPMEGVLFFIERPGLCIPHRDIASYEVLRAESSFSSSELVLYMKPDRGQYERYEFSFARPELGKLLTYLEEARLKVSGVRFVSVASAVGCCQPADLTYHPWTCSSM